MASSSVCYWRCHYSSLDSSPSALAFFFLLFLLSLRFLASSPLSSSSSSSLSVRRSSDLYQIGGWLIREGPPGRRAIVKWKPATKVPAGVYLMTVSFSKNIITSVDGILTLLHKVSPNCAARLPEDPCAIASHLRGSEC